jgi:hypothetical protein
MGISCHTCHAFSVSGLGKRFRAIATCHLTCHELAAGEGERVGGVRFVPRTPSLLCYTSPASPTL